MRFQLSRHAQEKLESREIPPNFLQSVLQSPQQIVPDQDGKKVYQSQFEFDNGKIYLVRAIILDSTSPAIVLTVYKTSQIRRYWREA